MGRTGTIAALLALCAAAAVIMLIMMRLMDTAPYSYKKIKKLPDAAVPDFCGGDYM